MNIDRYQKKYLYTIEQLVNFNINVPEIQRSADDDRINEIIEFQCHHYAKYKSFCFIGELTIYSTASSNPSTSKICTDSWFIIDGMHRYLAMKSPKIYELEPTYKICINIIQGIDGLTMEEAFLIINKARPVPDYVIRTTLQKSKGTLLKDLKPILSKEYKAYLTKSENPRAPNFNLDTFLSFLVKSPLLDEFPSLDLLLGYIKYANILLGSEENCSRKIKSSILAKCEKANISQMLYFSADPHYDWMYNKEWIRNYLYEKQKPIFTNTFQSSKLSEKEITNFANNNGQNGDQEKKTANDTNQSKGKVEKEYTGKISKKRATIPKVVRKKLWFIFYGKDFEGLCKCCEMNTISMDNFDAGHIVSHKDGGSDMIGNLVPICRPCNLSMGTEHMNDFCKKINPNAKKVSEWVKHSEKSLNDQFSPFDPKKETLYNPHDQANISIR